MATLQQLPQNRCKRGGPYIGVSLYIQTCLFRPLWWEVNLSFIKTTLPPYWYGNSKLLWIYSKRQELLSVLCFILNSGWIRPQEKEGYFSDGGMSNYTMDDDHGRGGCHNGSAATCGLSCLTHTNLVCINHLNMILFILLSCLHCMLSLVHQCTCK